MRARMFMAMAGGFVGASYTRRSLKNWFVTPASADEDTVHDLETLRARSRDMVRNALLATGAVNTVVMNVVGTGLSLLPRPDWEALRMTEEQADEWTAQVEREFRTWAESAECDVTRTQNFYGLQSLVFRSALESGDAFVLLPMIESRTNPYALRVQVVEADRVESPLGRKENAGNKVVAGVEMDANGAPVAYHVLRHHPGSPEGIKQEFIRVPAFGERTGQTYAALTGTSQVYTALQRFADDKDGSKTVRFRLKPINGSLTGTIRDTDAFTMGGMGMALGLEMGGRNA
jgi:capsid protein